LNDHGRTHWLTPEELDETQRTLYGLITGGARAKGPRAFALTDERGRLNGPFNAMLVSPEVGTALQELGSAIRFKSGFTGREREIAILELAVIRKADFEWYAHERVGKTAGLTDAELDAIFHGKPALTLSTNETLVRELVRTIARERDLDDATFAASVTALGEPILNDLIALVGYYDLLALSLRIWRTPLPDEAKPLFG
jgi:4-carboxymuconolactone decarboxylase